MAEQKRLVMLDPGHGGDDPGAIAGGIHEADNNLMLVLYEAELWRRLGVEVVLTRDSDRTVELMTRTAMENKVRPACFISHHMDAAPISKDREQNTTACGATVWLHSRAPQKYVDWAQDVIQEITAAGLSSNRANSVCKGHRSGAIYDYAVNNYTNSPSMLIELGFLSSPQNRTEYSTSYMDYAKGIVRATCRFLGWDSTGLDNTDSKPPTSNDDSKDKLIAELTAENMQLKARLERIVKAVNE